MLGRRSRFGGLRLFPGLSEPLSASAGCSWDVTIVVVVAFGAPPSAGALPGARPVVGGGAPPPAARRLVSPRGASFEVVAGGVGRVCGRALCGGWSRRQALLLGVGSRWAGGGVGRCYPPRCCVIVVGYICPCVLRLSPFAPGPAGWFWRTRLREGALILGRPPMGVSSFGDGPPFAAWGSRTQFVSPLTQSV